MHLNDKTIRTALKAFLESRKPSPHKVIDELTINNGNAIADVVCIYKHTHCFEIKGDGDNLDRLKRQVQFYNSTFSRITIVTTARHIKKAKLVVPEFWGIILIDNTNSGPTIRYHRKSRRNSLIQKEDSLYVLWKKELIYLAEKHHLKHVNKNRTRKDIAMVIANSLPINTIEEEIASVLTQRTKTF
ncbi:sce7726 family protein [Geomonas anaerohicana]|uniref:Sce7726 family protein n=1 Tax=Geomonas anaerohicana TaxID=2798583 RepID=A0ABS0YK65_9BACT|nr:sce7726 family protein [Geomonas anaerohicana]MBJ6752695.1 sce7726 family protein [Geomonas anaerohicana]